MRRIKAAMGMVAVVTAAIASTGAAAAPAQASSTYCQSQGGTYLCQYGMAKTTLADGTTEEFVIGTDNAVWSNWDSSDGTWNGWVSLGGVLKSQVYIYSFGDNDPDHFAIIAEGSDGTYWARERAHNGTWSAWEGRCVINEDFDGCQ